MAANRGGKSASRWRHLRDWRCRSCDLELPPMSCFDLSLSLAKAANQKAVRLKPKLRIRSIVMANINPSIDKFNIRQTNYNNEKNILPIEWELKNNIIHYTHSQEVQLV